MDILRRYLEQEKAKKGTFSSNNTKKAIEIQELDIEAFLSDYTKRHSPQDFKDSTPRYKLTSELRKDLKKYL